MINPEKLNFKHLIMTIGNLPSSYVESLSYYECLLWLCNYLENTVIPAVNNNASALEELQGLFVKLQEYVDNYFENLDVQEEINNKLDEMSEDGTLTNLIKAYVDPIIEDYEETINGQISNQNTRIDQQDNNIAEQSGKINVLEGRMDKFASLTEGSTTGDAELADIRVDFTGQSYSTAGDSVRGQVEYLNDKIDDIESYFKNVYVEPTLANGTIQNPGNANHVRTTDYIPIRGNEWLYIYVDPTILEENEIFYYGWSLFDESKTAVQHNAPAITNTSNVIRVANAASVRSVNVVLGIYNTSTEQTRAIRVTDFKPYQVQIKTGSKYFESLETAISTNTTNVATKLNNTRPAQQVYLANDSTYLMEKDSNENVFFKYTGNLIFRIGYSNQFTCSQILDMLSADYKGTSPSGETDCIKIPTTYNLVLDTEDSSQRIKVAPRSDVTNANRYISLLECVSGNIIGGQLMYLWTNLQTINPTSTNIPSYWNSALSTAINTVNTNIATLTDSNIESFFFITDQHWRSNAKNSSELIKYLGNKLQIPLVLSGGDVLAMDLSSKVSAIAEEQDYISSLENGYIRTFQTYGNHDDNDVIGNNTTYALTDKQVYNAMIKQREMFTFNSNDIDVMKYDNTDKHIRYINFKCTHGNGETADETMITKVLNLIKELDSTWSVVLFAHCYWDGANVYDVAAAYANAIATEAYVCDAEVVALFTGHVHDDRYTVVNASNGGKLLVISTTTDNYVLNNLVPNPPYTMTKGTDTEQAFDIVQIDTTNKHIYLTRVGAGNDRDFSY